MTMDQLALIQLLHSLIATWENEVVEFKQTGNDYSTDDIGKYFSALANEANLRDADCGWLVFGISNKTRRVVGTDYRPQVQDYTRNGRVVVTELPDKLVFENEGSFLRRPARRIHPG